MQYLYRINQFFFEIDRSYRYINLNDMQKGVNFNFLSPNYQKKQFDLSEFLDCLRSEKMINNHAEIVRSLHKKGKSLKLIDLQKKEMIS